MPYGHWDAIHFLYHGEIVPQYPSSRKWIFSGLEWSWAPETGKEAYVLCPQPRRIGIWPEQNRKMTDLEAVHRSAACLRGIHTSTLPVRSFWSSCCQHSRQSLFIEEHCFGFPTASWDSAMRLLSLHKAIDSGRMVCNLQNTLFSAHGKTKHKRLLQNNLW